jgi:iron(III) transport system substrate-binding protein
MRKRQMRMPDLLPCVLASLSIGFVAAGCSTVSKTPDQVVVYSSVDEVFARPIAERFQEETSVQVQLVPDTEETKSTGLLNRLIAEKGRPQADVFWSGDPVRAAILKSRDVSTPYKSPAAAGLPALYSDPEGHWIGFSARARVLIYNKNLVPAGQEPASVLDLLDPRFKTKACIANPLFGTTAMHAAALFQVLGEENARQFFSRFIENGGRIVSSNGEVRRRVAAGDFAIGITDTDDFNVAFQEGKPVGVVYPDEQGMGTLVIPNVAVLIKNGPNPAGGKRFIDYLLGPKTERALAESEAAQIPLRPGVSVPEYVRTLDRINPMQVDYGKLANILEHLSNGFLKEWTEANSL